MEKMFKRLLSLVMVMFMVLSMVPGTVYAAEDCDHSIVLYSEAVEGSCITPPKQALYMCEHCNTLFVDAEGTQKAEGESMVFPEGHDLVFVPARAATNTQPGNLAHYLCLVCQGTYETEDYFAAEEYDAEIPVPPTASVKAIDNDDLTFAMNFKADAITEKQLAYYGDWYADFELTLNKDVTFYTGEGADGYLAGQYDDWSANWVKVPYNKSVTVQAGETIRIMEFASELMGKPGLKYTFREVYDSVKDFDCGLFFNTEFLMENPDLKVTLNLRMYNNEDETQTYSIGETYEFTLPQVPTATVTEIENDDLTFAMNFKADAVTDEQLDFYGDWYADYVLTINKDAVFNADGSADGYLSGHYASYSENWINVPFENVVAKANEPVRIMKLAAEMLNKPELLLTYNDVAKLVKDFDCGVFFDAEYLAANPDLKVTLELRMYQTDDEEEQGVVIGEKYVFEAPSVAKIGDVEYKTLAAAVEAANDGDTIVVINDLAVISTVIVDKNVTIDLNGKTVSAALVNTPAFRILGDVTVTGGTVDASNGSGCYAFIVGSNEAAGTLNIADGTYKGNVSAVSVTKGVANISGGTFSVSDSQWGATYLLNCIDDNVMNGTAKFVVTGGAFVGFNPKSNAAENPAVSFCAPGYKGVDDGTGTYIVEQSADVVAWNVQTGVEYEDVEEALDEAASGETVQLVKDSVTGEVYVRRGRTLDLNSYTLTVTYDATAANATAYIIDSSNGSGILAVAQADVAFNPANKYLPVWVEGEGFHFVTHTFTTRIRTHETHPNDIPENAIQFRFWMDGAKDCFMAQQMANGGADNGVSFKIKMNWVREDGTHCEQYFTVTEALVADYASSWDTKVLKLTIKGATSVTDVTFTAMMTYGNVQFASSVHEFN